MKTINPWIVFACALVFTAGCVVGDQMITGISQLSLTLFCLFLICARLRMLQAVPRPLRLSEKVAQGMLLAVLTVGALLPFYCEVRARLDLRNYDAIGTLEYKINR